jgi:hypothetical protein
VPWRHSRLRARFVLADFDPEELMQHKHIAAVGALAPAAGTPQRDADARKRFAILAVRSPRPPSVAVAAPM